MLTLNGLTVKWQREMTTLIIDMQKFFSLPSIPLTHPPLTPPLSTFFFIVIVSNSWTDAAILCDRCVFLRHGFSVANIRYIKLTSTWTVSVNQIASDDRIIIIWRSIARWSELHFTPTSTPTFSIHWLVETDWWSLQPAKRIAGFTLVIKASRSIWIRLNWPDMCWNTLANYCRSGAINSYYVILCIIILCYTMLYVILRYILCW